MLGVYGCSCGWGLGFGDIYIYNIYIYLGCAAGAGSAVDLRRTELLLHTRTEESRNFVQTNFLIFANCNTKNRLR